MSNRSLTLAINEIWDIFEGGSIAPPNQSARRTMARLLLDLANNSDCDIHNINPTLKRLAED